MWQPIETAPRNQTFLAVLNCAGGQTICTMRWPVAEAKNSRPDSKTFHVERVTHWMPLPDLPGAQAQSVPNAVAYLDLGVGGYMDIGTDLTDEELATLPKGRHMLGVIGTYGVDGYVPAQPTLSVPDGWLPVPEKHPTFDPVDLQLSDGSVLCGCVPQVDGDYWWEGPSGEVFIDPKYASVTHWRLAVAPETNK